MALPSSKPISLSQVASELGVGLPISLTQASVRALAGVSSGQISLSDLLGKSASGIVSPLNGGLVMQYDTAVTGSSTTSLAVRVQVDTDGTITIKKTSSVGGDTYLYYNPITASIGANYYVKAVVTSISSAATRSGSAVNSVLRCNSIRYWTFTITGQNYASVDMTHTFYSNSAGTTVVTSGSVRLSLEIAY